MPGLDDNDTMVSRETIDPTCVRQLFGDSQSIYCYVDILTNEAVARGLLGPREIGRVWTRHIINCAVIEAGLPSGSAVADIGSGAGLPGLVLAIARPDLHLTLIEPLLRRATFLHEALEKLALSNVEVVRARAEDLHGRHTYGAITSRAVAPLDRLVSWCWPLVRPGGAMLAIKGASAVTEVAAQAGDLRRRGLTATVEHYGGPIVSPPTTVVRIQSQRDAKEE